MINFFDLGKLKCQKCGKELGEGQNFCGYCGTPSPKGKLACPNPECGAPVAADASFCGACGSQLRGNPHPTMEGHRWARGPEDFATRVEVEDVPGYFKREVVVEPGTRAILLEDGRNVAGEVGPGRYTLDSLIGRIFSLGQAKRLTAILMDAGDVPLEFNIPKLYTTDPLAITLDCRLVARIDNAVLFLTNFMKGARTVGLGQLRSYLFPEIQNAAAAEVARRSVAQLNTDLTLKDDLSTAVAAHLLDTFRGMGLKFDRVSTLNFRHERWDQIRQIREELLLQVSREEAEVAGRKRLADALDAKELLAIAEETRKVAYHEQRIQLWDRMRQAVATDRMAQVRTEEDFARFLRGIDRQRLMEETELEELRREYRERKEDQDRSRAHLLAKADLERGYELRAMELARRRDLTLAERTLEQDVSRQKVAGDLEIQESRLVFDLRRQRQEAESAAALQRLKVEVETETRRKEALAAAAVGEIERDQDAKDLEMGLAALSRMKVMQAEESDRNLRRELEAEKVRLDMQLAAEERRAEIKLKSYREERKAELERIEALSRLSVEALVAASGAEQGRMLVELKRTEALQGMNEQQILALAAEKSPEVAKAFQEKFRSAPGEELKAMYERMLQGEKGSREEQARLAREMMATQERMFQKALDAQRDTATAFARDRGTPPIVVTPGSGGIPTILGANPHTGNGLARAVMCQKCGVESPVGTRFCKNCGAPFFEVHRPSGS